MVENYRRKVHSLKQATSTLRDTRKQHEASRDLPSSQLLDVASSIDKGNFLMGDSLKTMRNVNEQDKATMHMLKRQTDTLRETNSKLLEADHVISRSDKVLRNLIRKVFTNKMVLIAIMILLGFMIMVLLYMKIRYKLLGSMYTLN